MRFFLIWIVVCVGHLAVSALMGMFAFGAGMRSFTYDGPTGADQMWMAYRVWNCGALAAVALEEKLSPLPSTPKTGTWPPEFYAAIEARGRNRTIIFLLWPVFIGGVAAGIDHLWRRNHP